MCAEHSGSIRVSFISTSANPASSFRFILMYYLPMPQITIIIGMIGYQLIHGTFKLGIPQE